jgi:NAD-dependent deacetylase
MNRAILAGGQNKQLERVAHAIRGTTEILVISGAGISADSGLPTFRGAGGWWRSRNPEELATLTSFQSDPRFVWEWYDYRRKLVAEAQPNAAHRVIAWLDRVGKRVFIITQNVDDLHERAGSRTIVHIHGSIWSVTCMMDGRTFEDRGAQLPELPPRCPCGGLLRPGVVWFDEELPVAECARIESYFASSSPGVALIVGTQATFDYIRSWALRAKRAGALLVEVNSDDTALTPDADVVLQGRAAEVFEAIKTLTADCR